MKIRIGTRFSPLALWQAETVSRNLKERGHEVELVKITTSGDVSTTPLGASGGVGVFTKEIQRALLDNRCDVAVHSLKDLPTAPVEGLVLAAVPAREFPGDCLVSRTNCGLVDLPNSAVVGSGSPRRKAQLLKERPDLQIRDIRGNVETRLKKLENGEYDAILLAYAGLHRLGLNQYISHRLPFETMLPAAGQAALGLEARENDTETRKALQELDDEPSHFVVRIERGILRLLKAGCLAPVGVLAESQGVDHVSVRCRVFSPSFSDMLEFCEVFSAVRDSKSPMAVVADRIAEAVFTELVNSGASDERFGLGVAHSSGS